MATAEFSGTANAARATANPSGSVTAVVSGQVAAKSDGTDGAAFTAALATLVADGASPTQAHVTAVNNAWTTYKADIDAQTTSIAALTADVTVYIGNVANVADINIYENIMARIKSRLLGSGILAAGSATPRSP